MSKEGVFEKISKQIIEWKQEAKPYIVGINGVDGSGKTQFAAKLSSYFDQVVCIHIDDFHNSKQYRYRRGEESPEAFYYDSINYDGFVNSTLKPIKRAERYPVRIKSKLFNLEQDHEDIQFTEISNDSVVLVEGIFLFRPEIAQLLDMKIFIDCDFDITLKRMKNRDVKDGNNHQAIRDYERRTQRKYVRGQELYFSDISPRSVADIIIDNNDYNAPKIIYST